MIEILILIIRIRSSHKLPNWWPSEIYCQISNIRCTKSQNWNVSRLSCRCLCPIHWSQVLSPSWRCSWSSTDRQCSNYIWVINNFYFLIRCVLYVKLRSELLHLSTQPSFHDDTMLSVVLALCEGNPLVTKHYWLLVRESIGHSLLHSQHKGPQT